MARSGGGVVLTFSEVFSTAIGVEARLRAAGLKPFRLSVSEAVGFPSITVSFVGGEAELVAALAALDIADNGRRRSDDFRSTIVVWDDDVQRFVRGTVTWLDTWTDFAGSELTLRAEAQVPDELAGDLPAESRPAVARPAPDVPHRRGCHLAADHRGECAVFATPAEAQAPAADGES